MSIENLSYFDTKEYQEFVNAVSHGSKQDLLIHEGISLSNINNNSIEEPEFYHQATVLWTSIQKLSKITADNAGLSLLKSLLDSTRDINMNNAENLLMKVKWIFLFESFHQLHSILQKLLYAHSLKLSDCQSHWKGTLESPTAIWYHFASTLPHRVYKTINHFHWKRRTMYQWYSMYLSPFTLYNRTRKQIEAKYSDFINHQKEVAYLLGATASFKLSNITTNQNIDIDLLMLELTRGIAYITCHIEEPNPVFEDPKVPLPLDEVYISIQQLIETAERLESELTLRLSTFKVPSFWTRYWIPLTIAGSTSYWLYSSYKIEDLRSAISIGAEALKNFVSIWIVDPIKDIWQTIRYKENRLALLGTKSLNSDLESLERMVIDFAKKSRTLDSDEITSLVEQTRSGDLSIVYRHYEEEMKNPIRNIVAGDMIRLVLIQIQKSKVDLELAMSALDKLLKANELNFALLAIIPSALVLGYMANYLIRFLRSRQGLSQTKLHQKIREQLRVIEKILNVSSDKMSFTDFGFLLINVNDLKRKGRSLKVSKSTRQSFLEDISELESRKRTLNQKVFTLQRMYRTFPFLLP